MCKRELTEFLAELTEFAVELSEFSLPKQYSRNSIPPVSQSMPQTGEGRSEVPAEIRACKHCASGTGYPSVQPDEQPEALRGLSQETVAALSPLDVNGGPVDRTDQGYRRVHLDYTHSSIILELISVLITLTLTPFIVWGINCKSVIGAFWDYTCTPEITLTLLNCFQINFPKISLTLTLLLVLN